MAATSTDNFGGSSLEAVASRGNGPSVEPAWRVVQASDTRRAIMLDQRGVTTRVRRALPASNSLNNALDKQKAIMTTPGRESAERPGNSDSSARRDHMVSASVGGGTPTSPLAASLASTGPIVQVSSWFGHEGHDKAATSTSASESRPAGEDLSPTSPPESAPAQAFASKRRATRRQPQKGTDDDEARNSLFGVSGIQMQAQKRGATLAVADAAASIAAREAAPAVPEAIGKKVAAMKSPHAAADPQELADALTMALGQLQGSTNHRAWQPADASANTVGARSQTSQERPIRVLLPAESISGYPSPSQVSPTAPRSPPPLTLKAAAMVSSKGSPDRKVNGNSKEIKRACVSGGSDDSPASGPPGSAPMRRESTTQRTPAAPAAAAMRRSRSMPATDKTEKAKGSEKPQGSEKTERASEKAEKNDKRKAASSSPGTKESGQAAGRDSSNSGAVGKADKRENAKPPVPTTTSQLLPKSSPSAAAGAGSVAAKNRKKGGLPRKLVLPFSYGFDDPRYWHVETTEGRTCPQFLPG